LGYSGKFREWGRKQRRTCNGGVPKTKETRHMGDHMLVQISTFFKIKNYDTNIVSIVYFVYLYGKKTKIVL
jgi:hypothetical protein